MYLKIGGILNTIKVSLFMSQKLSNSYGPMYEMQIALG